MRFLHSLVFAVLLLSALRPSALAQRIVFQRGDALFTVGEDGQNPVRLLTIGDDTLWSASPGGRRIAWLTRAVARPDTPGTGLLARPATVFLSDFSGRKRKRLLSTDKLRDRQGRTVTLLALPLPGSDLLGTGNLNEWEPVSLSWSADGRTLYFSCSFVANPSVKATFALDAVTGTAIIDAEGRWKSLGPMAQPDAQGQLIVGVGYEQHTNATEAPPVTYAPIYVINLLDGTRQPIYTPEKTVVELPDYAFAASPTLAPENRAIVFSANNKGLWLTDKFGKSYRRVLDGNALCPRWSGDGKSLFCLLPRSTVEDKVIYDLFRLPAPSFGNNDTAEVPPPPPTTPLLTDVTWFDTVEE